MFEKRPIWGIIVGLNVCILIWLISVQEPVMFDANTAALSSSNNFIINAYSGAEGPTPVASSLVALPEDSNGWSRDLLSKHIAAQSNEYVDQRPEAISTLTTLKRNNNNNNSNNTTSKQTTFSHTFDDVKTTTKTSDLSSDIQSLTSSLGTGVLDLKTKPTPSWATLTAAAASALPDEDFSQLIDLHNFQFLMLQPVCGSHIEALILIHSAPRNYEKRQVIRETWASISHHRAESPLQVLFLLGAVDSEQVQEDLENENNKYRDIIQGSFIDDYRNMTYKHIMAFKWFLYNCPQAQVLIKVDDDVYVNTPQLIKYLKEQQQTEMNNTNNDNPTMATTVTLNTNFTTITSSTTKSSSIFNKFNIFASAPPTAATFSSALNASQELFNHPQNLLFCQKIIGSLVKRSYRSKWRVSFREYSERYYPPYCPGYAIIYSPDVIFRLYTAAQNSKYFWIDDVHITGVLAQQTNTTITTSSHYVLFSDECDQILTGKTDLSKTEFLFAWHSISAQKIQLLWHLQMMSIQTPDDLLYHKKVTMNESGLYEGQHQHQPQQQRHQQQKTHKQTQRQQSANDDEYLVNNEISSSYTHTSANGFR